MTSAIEIGSRHIREKQVQEQEQQALNKVNQTMFDLGISILSEKGVLVKALKVFSYQEFYHTVQSIDPPVGVRLWAGANLENARAITMLVDGIEGRFRVYKRDKKGQKYFSCERIVKRPKVGFVRATMGLEIAQKYLQSIEQLADDLAIQRA